MLNSTKMDMRMTDRMDPGLRRGEKGERAKYNWRSLNDDWNSYEKQKLYQKGKSESLQFLIMDFLTGIHVRIRNEEKRTELFVFKILSWGFYRNFLWGER